MTERIAVGVLALQGAFYEHLKLLEQAVLGHGLDTGTRWGFFEVRNAEELSKCDALIIPGGESTTMALVAERSGLLEPLRHFVKVQRKPTWGTCAGLILLAESANRTKKGGQDLIGGLDVRVNRNHFGRQTESFEADLRLPFLPTTGQNSSSPFNGIFIRAPIVEKVLPVVTGVQAGEANRTDTIVAPARVPADKMAAAAANQPVEVIGILPNRKARLRDILGQEIETEKEAGDIIAVKQGNVFGTSFHPELTADARIHAWWLKEIREARKMQATDRPTSISADS